MIMKYKERWKLPFRPHPRIRSVDRKISDQNVVGKWTSIVYSMYIGSKMFFFFEEGTKKRFEMSNFFNHIALIDTLIDSLKVEVGTK